MWRKIVLEGIETGYEVSSEGQVRKTETGYILKQHYGQGYCIVSIVIEGKSKRVRVHRLVAGAFIPNPENKPFVNHKDGVRDNNNVENLEWATPKENSQHAARELGRSKLNGRSRPVVQYSLSGEEMMTFESGAEAARQTGAQQSKISDCCRGKRDSAAGYQWRFLNDNDLPVKMLDDTFKHRLPSKLVAKVSEDGNILETFPSYAEAARSVDGQPSAISRICSGKTVNIRHKGYRWILVDEIVQ